MGNVAAIKGFQFAVFPRKSHWKRPHLIAHGFHPLGGLPSSPSGSGCGLPPTASLVRHTHTRTRTRTHTRTRTRTQADTTSNKMRNKRSVRVHTNGKTAIARESSAERRCSTTVAAKSPSLVASASSGSLSGRARMSAVREQ